jgi:hypothetical protein
LSQWELAEQVFCSEGSVIFIKKTKERPDSHFWTGKFKFCCMLRIMYKIVSSTDPPLLQIVFSLKTNGFCCQFRIVLHEISKDLNKVNSSRSMEGNIHFKITHPRMSEIIKKNLRAKLKPFLMHHF